MNKDNHAYDPQGSGKTDDEGVFKIENVPTGKRTIRIWHETLGISEKTVDIQAGKETKILIELTK